MKQNNIIFAWIWQCCHPFDSACFCLYAF